MKTVSPDKARALAVTRVAGLFILAVAGIAFLASPMVSFADNQPAVGCTSNATHCDLVNNNGVTTVKQYPATFVAAFTVKPGATTTDTPTLTPDPNFKLTDGAPTTGTEIVEDIFNNQTVFALYRGRGRALTAQDYNLTLTDSSNKPQGTAPQTNAHVHP